MHARNEAGNTIAALEQSAAAEAIRLAGLIHPH